MHITFRQAVEADIPVLSHIRLAVKENVLSNPARITTQMYVDYLDLLGRGWVAEAEGRVIGFSYAEKADASIWALFVLPEYEGHGVGKGLLDLAVAWLFSLGKEKVILGTQADTRADAFYLARGWSRGDMLDQTQVGYTLRNESA